MVRVLLSEEDETQLLLPALSDAQAAGQGGSSIDTTRCKPALNLPPALDDRVHRAEPWHLLSVHVRPPVLAICTWSLPLSPCASTSKWSMHMARWAGVLARAVLSCCQVQGLH